jgi:hypothetical protein
MTDSDFKKTWTEIEQLREKLHNVASRKGIRSPEAIRASQALDNSLNEYHYWENRKQLI